MKYVFFILLVVVLITSLSLSSCRLAYRAGQESASQSDAPNTQQQAPNTPVDSPAPSNPQPRGLPVIDRFDAYRIGASSTWALSWSVSNATSVTLSPYIGAVALAENRTVSILMPEVYTLTAINPAGSRSKSITLTH